MRDNPFICRVNQALEKVDGGEIFPHWVSESQKAFLSRNLPGLPTETFPLHGSATPDLSGEGMLMDARCFTDHFNAIASTTQAMHMEQQQTKHMLNDLRSAFNNESELVSSLVAGKMFNIEKTVLRLASNLIGETPSPVAALSSPLKGVIRFSVSSKSLPKHASLTEVTAAFFVDDCSEGYAFETKTPAWKDMETQERKSIHDKFGSIKRAVRTVLMHADSYPLMHDDRSKHKDRNSCGGTHP